MKCLGKNCDKPPFARGMCRTHYSRWRIHGDCEILLIKKLPCTCEVDGCTNKSHTRWKKGKVLCNKHWQAMHKYGVENPVYVNNTPPLPLCAVHKCGNVVVSRNNPHCDKHFGRLRRGADMYNDRVIGQRYTTAAGYVVNTNSSHPLSGRDKRVYEHRQKAYDAHGGQCPSCFWCGKSLSWDTSVVDHLDENKSNNNPDNLVVACNVCNRARGAMLPFIARVMNNRIDVLFAQIRLYRAAVQAQERADGHY